MVMGVIHSSVILPHFPYDITQNVAGDVFEDEKILHLNFKPPLYSNLLPSTATVFSGLFAYVNKKMETHCAYVQPSRSLMHQNISMTKLFQGANA